MSLCTKASAGLLAILLKHPGPIFLRLTTGHFFTFLNPVMSRMFLAGVARVPLWAFANGLRI